MMDTYFRHYEQPLRPQPLGPVHPAPLWGLGCSKCMGMGADGPIDTAADKFGLSVGLGILFGAGLLLYLATVR